MAYYAELGDIINNVIAEKLLRNQTICKALKYYPTENSIDYNPLTQPDISDTRSLLMDKIFPLPKMPNSDTEKHGYVTVTLTGGDSAYDNQGYRYVNLVFDIIFHLDTWCTQAGYRPYLIAEELDKMFNNQQTDLPIANRPLDLGFKQRDYSNYFYGLQLVYQLSLDSNVGCGTTPVASQVDITMNQRPSFLPKNLNLR